MITFDDAYRIVMESVFETETESVPFNESSQRILAEDIVSDIDMPPFNRSAVDGYTCRMGDLNYSLEIVETIAAGKIPVRKVGKGQCAKIMTGAIVPEGCDIVFMVEDSEITEPGRVRFKGSNHKPNLSLRGEDVHTGDIVLRKPRVIQPQDIAIMASVGHTEVFVKAKPVIGIISTGDELIDPSQKPGISQIRNSNAYQLIDQVKRAGGIAINCGIAPDNESVTFDIIEKAINYCNIVIITGGVSMGDFDFVPSVLKRAGVKILFDRINVQPGKPTTFGIHKTAAVFGLPGNPVSSFIQFEMLVRPFINMMMGYRWNPLICSLPMAIDFQRKSTDRLGFIPVRVTAEREVFPVDFHGSAHIAAMSDVDGVISLNPGVGSLQKGEIVNVRQI
jgi:molybdopterin molybdotransferase